MRTTEAAATHFRFGHLTWQTEEGTQVQFVFQGAFRRNGYSGSGTDRFPVTGDVIQERIGGTRLCFGDGVCTGTLYFKVTAYDPVNNWIIGLGGMAAGEESILHVYPSTGVYVPYSESCCRISRILSPNAHINNPDEDYRIETQVTLKTP